MLLSELLTNSARLMQKFGFSASDAEDVLAFTTAKKDWDDLGDGPREKLYAWGETTDLAGYAKANEADPVKFIRPALKTFLGL